ncbi:hypothetical protein BCR35DRAFT_18771 [Leucosporidium creatinivorum]|uniref:FHA domain-containing protein n=1 Tax=Leucosporidium creatinivorum TaxID=106004 RepID=A0A1Y2D0I3_9BASI|nr:hypothetical protein BCR35DRAFT_18771 [Leucosporidium creatinivorum]
MVAGGLQLHHLARLQCFTGCCCSCAPPRRFTIRKQQPRTGMAPAPYADSSHSKPAPSSLAPSAPSSSAPSGASAPSSVFPALHLIPLNETFVPKQISLNPPGARVKIGRQTNAKTIPNGSNGYFDSKVLSRMHAEVWSEDGKVLIKDVKSSNGTFIDGQRLSAEAAESDVFELRTGSTVEFGIDIVSDDSKTIVHHKVAAKVHVVMNTDDALASSREFNAWFRNAGDQPSQRRGARPLGGGQQQNGLSFEHVLNRLQGELQKSRDTGSNLGDLSSTLNDVQDTLGGGAPPPNFAASQRGIPPYLPNGHSPSSDHHAQSIAALQSQLNETQTSLAGHVGKIRDLEGLLAEHDVIKREVGSLRKQMEEAKRDMERMMRTRGGDESAAGGDERATGADGRESPIAKLLEQQEDDEAGAVTDDDDDARSISSVDTISPSNSKINGVLSAVAGAAAGAAASKLTSATTSNDDDQLARSNAAAATAAAKEADLARERQLQEQNAKLSARLETLSAELDEATKLGQSLRSQHAEASSTIRALEERVLGLEKAVEGRVKEVEGKVLKECEGKWEGWREKFEEGWRRERAGWEEEREKLMAVVREWEERRRDSSGSEDGGETDEEDGDGSSSRDVGSASSTGSSATLVDSPSSDASSSATATSSSPNSSSKSKSRSRRRRRSTATAPGSGSRISKLAKGTSSAVASDSDSTIGSGEGVGRGVGSWGNATRGPGGVNGFDDETNKGYGVGNSQSATTYASAGVVVAIGVVAAYALSLKMKE